MVKIDKFVKFVKTTYRLVPALAEPRQSAAIRAL
jgi:hypothetical protein